MKLFVVLFVLVSLVTANASFDIEQKIEMIRQVREFTEDALLNLNQQARAIASTVEFSSAASALSSKPQLQLSTACQQAYAAFASKYFACIGSVQNIYSDRINVTSVTVYCGAGGCREQLKTAAQTVVNSCNSTDISDSQLSSFTNMVRQIDIPCVQDTDGSYCWPAFWKSVNSSNVNNLSKNNYSAAVLDQFCTSCTRLVIMAFYAANGTNTANLAKSYDSLCLKANGEYCLVFLQNNAKAPQTDDPNVVIDYFIRVYCDNPCAGLILRAVAFAANPGNFSVSQVFDLMCAKDGSTPCLKRMLDLQSSTIGTTCPDPKFATNFTTCSADCKTDFDKVKSTMGCCLNAYAGFYGIGDDGATTRKIVRFFTVNCGKTFPGNCAPRGVVRAALAVRNLLYSYYVNNKAAVETKLKTDVSVAISTDPSNINISGAESVNLQGIPSSITLQSTLFAVSQGVKFSIEVSAPTLNQAQSMQTSLQNQISSSQLPLPQLSSLPAAALVDPAASVTFDSTASSVTATSGASIAQMSVFAIIFVALTAIKLL